MVTAKTTHANLSHRTGPKKKRCARPPSASTAQYGRGDDPGLLRAPSHYEPGSRHCFLRTTTSRNRPNDNKLRWP